MKRYDDKETIQQGAILALATLAWSSTPIQEAMAELGAARQVKEKEGAREGEGIERTRENWD